MAIEFAITGIRPNTNAPLWWQSTDPVIKNICDTVKNTCVSGNIPHSITYSEDELQFFSKFTFPSDVEWYQWLEQVDNLLPNWKTIRQQYFVANEHILYITVTDLETETVLRQNMLIPT